MHEVSKGGRTVLFVSHNMAIINALCPTAILLQAGTLKSMGNSGEVSTKYLATNTQATYLERPQNHDGSPTITRFELTRVECHGDTAVEFTLEIKGRVSKRKRYSVEVKLFDAIGIPIGFASVGLLSSLSAIELREELECLRCRMVLPRMARGTYRLSVQLAVPMVEVIDSIGDGLMFELHPIPLSGYERVMELNWGYGAIEVPLKVERCSPSCMEEIKLRSKEKEYAIDPAARFTCNQGTCASALRDPI